jgi:hypothetical protein
MKKILDRREFQAFSKTTHLKSLPTMNNPLVHGCLLGIQLSGLSIFIEIQHWQLMVDSLDRLFDRLC